MPPRMRSRSPLRAVSMSTGTSEVSCSASPLMLVSTCQPSRPGIITSRITRSGRSRRSTSRPSGPAAAVRTRCPSRSRLIRTMSRISASSSTTNTVAMAVARLATGWLGLSDSRHPHVGLPDLRQAREPLRAPPRLFEQRRATLGLDRLDELLPHLVLLELGFEPDQLLHHPSHAIGVVAAVSQHTAEALGA